MGKFPTNRFYTEEDYRAPHLFDRRPKASGQGEGE